MQSCRRARENFCSTGILKICPHLRNDALMCLLTVNSCKLSELRENTETLTGKKAITTAGTLAASDTCHSMHKD